MDAQTGKKQRQHMSWRNVVVTLLVIILALWVVYPATTHVMVWYFARKEARDPRCAIMPRPLLITEMADLSDGSEAKAFGYSFRVPWKIAKQHGARSFSTLEFSNGLSAMVTDDSSDSAGPGILVNSTPAEVAAYKATYGEKELSSKYEFLRAEFSASPADVSFWNSRAHNAGVMTKLLLKSMEIREAKALYAINLGDLHGFQVGDAAKETRLVRVWLFDPADRETWIFFYPGNAARWTQPQINAIIASIHPTQ